jgi:dsRNA-specific ribonuclease
MVRAKLAQKEKAAPDMSDLLYVITGCGMGYMGFMEHPKCLGDIMESAIGAVYLDTGMNMSLTYPVCLYTLPSHQ